MPPQRGCGLDRASWSNWRRNVDVPFSILPAAGHNVKWSPLSSESQGCIQQELCLLLFRLRSSSSHHQKINLPATIEGDKVAVVIQNCDRGSCWLYCCWNSEWVSEKLNLVYSNPWSQRSRGQKYLKSDSVYIFSRWCSYLKEQTWCLWCKDENKGLGCLFS